MLLDILTFPHPTLKQKSRPVSREEILNSQFKKFIKDLGETMLKNEGVGLAAPQVNQSIRAIIININQKPMPFINPLIIKKSWRKNVKEEGCLSLPNIYGLVKRHNAIAIRYLDINGQEQQLKAKGLLARVLQHEIDHLEGVLFVDRINKINKIHNLRLKSFF